MTIKIIQFFKSFNFIKATILAFAMVFPILFFQFIVQDINLGFSIALGVLFSSPSNVPGSTKHNFYGILTAIGLSVVITFIFGGFIHTIWAIIPILGIAVFLVSYLAVYGFRASQVAFSGLLAIALSFANNYDLVSVELHSLLVGVGGLWYLLLTMIYLVLFPKIQTDYLFAETVEKTAQYLKIRGTLLTCNTKREGLHQQLFKLQTEITDFHEIIRSIIFKKSSSSSLSNRIRRQQLFFSELVDILELAIANPVNYEKIDKLFKNNQEITGGFKELIIEMANYLEDIAKTIRDSKVIHEDKQFLKLISKIEIDINTYKNIVGLPKSREGTLMLLNLKNYQEKQVQKIIGLDRILRNYTYNKTILNSKDATKFITPQDYDLKKLKENFSLKSPIFKHSSRLSIIVLIGFVIGHIMEMQNPYWVLLTIIVIMRPNYGLTKERSINRVIGTFIGALIATIIILTIQNIVVYATISIIALPFAFSLVQQNYRYSAIFITLNVIFVYAIFEPNILGVIQFRILDTVIGALLSFISIHLMWPSWQYQNMDEFIIDVIDFNKKFLQQIGIFYKEKGEVSTTYKLSRKEAFLAMSNLNAAYQRMRQDPKSKQKDENLIYELVVINNTFLSSLTSLGAFIRNNKTSNVPKQFDDLEDLIVSNLELTCKKIKDKVSVKNENLENVDEVQSLYNASFDTLSKKRDKEIELGQDASIQLVEKLKETQLVSEQMKWLYDLSDKMVKTIKKYKQRP